MHRPSTTTALLLAGSAAVLEAQSAPVRTIYHDYRITTVAEGLINPWSMAWLPNGDMLVTERPGRLRILRKGKLLPNAVEGTPTVFARGQGGLLDVVLHPNFATNKFIYLTYAKPLGGDSMAATTAIARGTWENDRLTNVKDIFVATTKGAPGHFGSRLAFDKAGTMFVSVGERMVPPQGNLEAHPAQDLTNHHGKILRLNDDGTPAPGNPFATRDGAKPEIFSYGHRNPQGLIVHPVTGDIWATEHGPQGGDELNLIKAGSNYGWPVIGFGVNYRTGAIIHAATMREGMQQPVHVWVPSIGTSGLMYYTGKAFPAWQGSLFAGGLSGEQVARLTLDGQKAELAEIVVRRRGRIRDVRQGPDGFIYLAIDDNQGKPTPLLRLEPVAKGR